MRKNIYKTWMFLAAALFCLMGALPLSAQQRTVSGTVVDDDGNSLAGALVSVTSDPSRVAVSGADGSFSLQASTTETLTATFLGYMDATVTATASQVVITLQPDNTTLQEVVVVGYGTQRRATLTGAVSAVNNKELTSTRSENVINMMSGKLPGVRIMQTSSQPGDFGAVKMDIRGMGAPLVVVDGIPRSPDFFARMDANEIEQVSVLKDASAAIYGVQASNGVVLVTTKHGSGADGKFNITFSANYGIENFLYVPKTASAAQHMILFSEKQFNNIGGNYPFRRQGEYTWDEAMEYATGLKQSTNWSEELFRSNVPHQSYNVSMDGGSDKVKYYFNVGFADQQGSFRSGSLNFNRWNFRSNVDAKITDRLTATVQLSGYQGETNEPMVDMWTVYKMAWIELPNMPAFIDEERTKPAFDERMKTIDNAAALIDSRFGGFRQKQNINFDGSLSLNYEIPGVKGLSARAMYNYIYFTNNEKSLARTYKVYQIQETTGEELVFNRRESPYLERRSDPGREELMIFSLNYANKFGDHEVAAFAAWEERYHFADGFWGRVPMPANSEFMKNGELEGQTAGGGNLNEWVRQAFIGRAQYNYKQRYLAEFTIRADASSRFSKLGMWGYSPSVLLAWRISEEPWVKNAVPFLHNLKLRASHGKMGDDDMTNRQVAGYRMDPQNVAWYFDNKLTGGVRTMAVPNLDLTWLMVQTSNIGLDFDMWNGKLSGTFEVFRRVRKGLYDTPEAEVPVEVGSALPKENINSDMTFGWEFQLGHRGKIGSVDYWTSAQLSAAKNRWVYRLDTRARNSMGNWHRQDVSGRNKDIWWLHQEEGGRFSNYDEIENHFMPISQNALPGDYWYEDWNGDGIIDEGRDKHPAATYNLPVFNYGISAGAAWKGVDFSMTWQGSAGVYNSYNEVFTEVAPFDGGAALDIYWDRWHTVNPNDDPWNPHTQWNEGFYPATGHSFNTGTTGVMNSSYIRLKSLELGYTFPSRWLEKLSVRELRFYVSGYNLLTFAGKHMKYMDPERPGHKGSANNNGDEGVLFYNYPVARSFNFGATLKF